MRRLTIAALLAPALLSGGPAGAQAARGQAPPAARTPATPSPTPQPAPTPEPPAPFEKELLRLAEVLGALAFLRPLCSAPDAEEWQKRMRALIEAEGTSPDRRDRLAGAYNRGYQAYALTYRSCTPSGEEAIQRYLREGEALSRAITARYGG